MLDGHGDDLHRYSGKIRYNFSTNITGGTDHRVLMRVLSEALDSVGSYPEPWPFTLESEIAAKSGLGAENVAVTNGAVDAVYRLAHIGERGLSAINRPTFREYQDAAKMYHHTIHFFDTLGDIPERSDMIWLCNPNNPTGLVWDKKELISLSARHRRSMVVIDQAYADYTEKDTLTAAEAVEAGNMVLLSSLTKRFAVPGLRIGYAVGTASIISKIREYGIPWSVNGPAIAGARYLLRHDNEYPIHAPQLHMEALRIARAFRKRGIECMETDCNFILCRLPGRRAAQLKEYLVENHGILIRDASNFEGLGEEYFRVSAQGNAADDILIKAVDEWIHG